MPRFLLFAMGLMFVCLALLGAGYLLLPQERHTSMDQATLQPPPAETPTATSTESPTSMPQNALVVILTASSNTGTSPLSVKFDARDSYLREPSGEQLSCRGGPCFYTWRVYSGGSQIGVSDDNTSGTFEYTFGKSGYYLVTVQICRGKDRIDCGTSGLGIEATATSTPTLTSTTTSCIPPGDWTPYIVKPGETLFSIAIANGTTVERLMQANCLTDNLIHAGQSISLPPLVQTSTPTMSLLPITPPPSGGVIRINFPAGTSSSTLSGVLGAQGKVHYILRAFQGQNLSVKVTGSVNEIELGIYAPNGSALKPLDTTLTWSGTISSNGEYRIEIVNILADSNISYALEVSLVTSIPALTPTATETVPPGEPTSTPGSISTPTAILSYLFEAEWPVRMEVGRSDTVRVSLIKVGNEYLPTVKIPGHTAVVSTPIYVGTPGQDLPSAFGTEYKAYVVAYLAGTSFSISSASPQSQSLDRQSVEWIWNISSDKPGKQIINASVEVEWRRIDNAAETLSGQVWRPPPIVIEVFQPIISRGQISLLSLISGFIGSGLSFPWLFGIFRPRKKVVPRKVKDKKRR